MTKRAKMLALDVLVSPKPLGKRTTETEQQVRKQLRDIMKNESRSLRFALRRRAPKKSGAYSRSIDVVYHESARGRTGGGGGYRIKVQSASASVLEASVSDDMAWLDRIIRYGSRPHEIPTGGAAAQKAKGYPLRFYWAKGPRGPGVYYFWSVNHPGTAPNDYPDDALKERIPVLRNRLSRMGGSVGRTWAGAGM